jgi:hypothetical protein
MRGEALILDSTGCVFRELSNDMGRSAQAANVQGVGSNLRVVYPDARVEPRICARTGMRRTFCPCEPCRVLRRRKHQAACGCWLCYADRMGAFVDDLGRRTPAARWLWFVTLTFRTPTYPWARGFPMEQPAPCPDFVNSFFLRMLAWIEKEVHAPVEYFVVHQFGELGGRLHLHCGLSWPGLFEYRWRDLQAMLWGNAGFNRILPWKRDAGFYIGRYIGRDAERSHWDFRVGFDSPRPQAKVGRQVIAVSEVPSESSAPYRQTLTRWHR